MAARLYAYTLLVVMLALGFNLIGLEIGSQSLNDLFNLVSGQISTSEFFEQLFDINTGILVTTVSATIIVGLFARGELENFILLPFITGTLVVFLEIFQSLIVTYSAGTYPTWGVGLISLLVLPLGVGYIITLVEWFRGNV